MNYEGAWPFTNLHIVLESEADAEVEGHGTGIRREVKTRGEGRVLDANLGVVAGIDGRCKEVLCAEVKACLGHAGAFHEFVAEGVADGQVLQTDIGAVLYHARREYLVGAGVADARDIAGAILLCPTVGIRCVHIQVFGLVAIVEEETVGIQDVVAITPLEEDTDIHAVERESVGEAAGMDGVSSSDDGLVVAVHHAVSVQVGIARVAGLRVLL